MSSQLSLWPQARPLERIRWSISRDRRLRDCARKYYYYHYASAGGRRPDASAQSRDLYILKHLRNRFMWVGEIVHALIELALNRWRRSESVTLEALVARGTRQMRAHYAESLQGVYRERPTQACGLVEHEYDEPVTQQEWQAQRDRMERCLVNFFALPLVDEIRRTPTWRWLALEATGSFDLDGATIIVKPDFAWRDPDGRVMMVDWKTGYPYADEADQLAVYGIFAQRVWGLGDRSMMAQLVYLNTAQSVQFEVGETQLQAAEADVRASVARMRRLGGATGDGPQEADFPQTDSAQACARCVFRRMCRRP